MHPRQSQSLHNAAVAKQRWSAAAVLFGMLSTGVMVCHLLSHPGYAGDTSPGPWKFVQLCDTQLGFGANGYDADIASLRQAVRQINEMKPDFVVVCGDLVNKAEAKSLDDFKRVMAELKVPYHCAAGNHDIGTPIKRPLLTRYRETLGKDYYQFQHNGYTFVIVNTPLWKAPLEPEAAEHAQWLAETLHAAKAKDHPVFVIGHHPLFLKDPDEKQQYYNIPPARRKELLALFAESGVVAVLTGHTHKLVDNAYQGMQFLSGETTSRNFDKRPLGFRVWTVKSPSDISHRFVPLAKAP